MSCVGWVGGLVWRREKACTATCLAEEGALPALSARTQTAPRPPPPAHMRTPDTPQSMLEEPSRGSNTTTYAPRYWSYAGAGAGCRGRGRGGASGHGGRAWQGAGKRVRAGHGNHTPSPSPPGALRPPTSMKMGSSSSSVIWVGGWAVGVGSGWRRCCGRRKGGRGKRMEQRGRGGRPTTPPVRAEAVAARRTPAGQPRAAWPSLGDSCGVTHGWAEQPWAAAQSAKTTDHRRHVQNRHVPCNGAGSALHRGGVRCGHMHSADGSSSAAGRRNGGAQRWRQRRGGRARAERWRQQRGGGRTRMQHWPERRSRFLKTSLEMMSSFFWSSPCIVGMGWDGMGRFDPTRGRASAAVEEHVGGSNSRLRWAPIQPRPGPTPRRTCTFSLPARPIMPARPACRQRRDGGSSHSHVTLPAARVCQRRASRRRAPGPAAHPAHGRGHKLAADADGIEQHGEAAAGVGRAVLLSQDPRAEGQRVRLRRGGGGGGR